MVDPVPDVMNERLARLRIGSIDAGRLADLVVLNQDCLTEPDEDVKRTRSVLTVVGGRVVDDAGMVG